MVRRSEGFRDVEQRRPSQRKAPRVHWEKGNKQLIRVVSKSDDVTINFDNKRLEATGKVKYRSVDEVGNKPRNGRTPRIGAMGAPKRLIPGPAARAWLTLTPYLSLSLSSLVTALSLDRE